MSELNRWRSELSAAQKGIWTDSNSTSSYIWFHQWKDVCMQTISIQLTHLAWGRYERHVLSICVWVCVSVCVSLFTRLSGPNSVLVTERKRSKPKGRKVFLPLKSQNYYDVLQMPHCGFLLPFSFLHCPFCLLSQSSTVTVAQLPWATRFGPPSNT